MAGSKSSNIILSLLSYAAATLMFVAILNVVPKAQAYTEEEAEKCLTSLSDIPGGKAYCNGLLKPSYSSNENNGQRGQDLEKCFSSIKKIEGCIGDIFFALFHGNFSKIAHECCEAVESIALECLLEMFPWNPMFPTMLVSFCKGH